MSRYRCIGVALILTLAGCASTPKDYIVLVAAEDGTTGAITVSNEQGTRKLDKSGQSVGLNEAADVAPRMVEPEELQEVFGAVLEVEPLPPLSFVLYFLTGGTQLTDESSALIGEIIDEIARREAPDIAVIGHTDTAGSSEANAALALQRAETTKDILLGAGANADLIEVSSHGENNPLVVTGDDVDEPRNRRVEIVIR